MKEVMLDVILRFNSIKIIYDDLKGNRISYQYKCEFNDNK